MAKRKWAAVDSTTVGPQTERSFISKASSASWCNTCGAISPEASIFIHESDMNGTVVAFLCADCLATGLERAMGVKMVGLMGSWRAMKAIKAEMNERRTAAKVDEKLNGSNTDAS